MHFISSSKASSYTLIPDKVVRDVSKMVERKQLSQSQARLLFRSLKPFEQRIEYATDALEDLEEKFQGLEVKKRPPKPI